MTGIGRVIPSPASNICGLLDRRLRHGVLRLLLGQALGEGRIDTARRDILLDAVNEMEKLASPGNSNLLPERART